MPQDSSANLDAMQQQLQRNADNIHANTKDIETMADMYKTVHENTSNINAIKDFTDDLHTSMNNTLKSADYVIGHVDTMIMWYLGITTIVNGYLKVSLEFKKHIEAYFASEDFEKKLQNEGEYHARSKQQHIPICRYTTGSIVKKNGILCPKF